jgi:hypothetical protein
MDKTSATIRNKIPFGLKDGVMVEVSDVESGRACGCVCPACKRPLQARKGQIKAHYFAHHSTAEAVPCASGFETSIHLMAKQIVDEDRSLVFPELIIRQEAEDLLGGYHSEEIWLEKSGVRFFDSVELEKGLDDMRPDITAYVGDEPILIEVAVTSFADDDKKRKIRKRQLPAIEIDLRSINYTITKNDLRELFNSASTPNKWLSHPRAEEAKRSLKTKLDASILQINESLGGAAGKTRAFENLDALQFGIRLEAPPMYPLSRAEKGHCKSRWFHCQSCRCNFELLGKDVPIQARTVSCPDCQFPVSTSRPPRRY